MTELSISTKEIKRLRRAEQRLKHAESQLETIEGMLWLRNQQLLRVDEDGAKVNEEWMRDHGNDELIGHVKAILKIRAF